MATSSKRPEQVAWVSLILSVVFFGITFLLGRWSDFFAVWAVSWFFLSAVLIWFVLAVQFHTRGLAEQEKLDIGQLTKDKESSAIFQGKGERAALFAVAERRLQVLEKWFIPIFSGLLALYQLGIGLYLYKTIPDPGDIETKQPLLCAIWMTAIAFVSFLMSRYATGMSAEPKWKPLRAGGSFGLGIAVLCFASAIGLALSQFHFFTVINITTYVCPILLVVLGVETALNVILDVYRPRLKGQYSRSAFDSRLLGLINEPGGILRSAASAIDYQFGFKVSQTWFYKLLEKWIVTLILFGVVTLYLLSCIVVVNPDEQAIIEHFGNPLNGAGQKRLVGPGLALKWPWPIDIVYKDFTERIMELHIGYVPKIDEKTGEIEREPLLWGEAHYEKEYQLLVAGEQSGVVSDDGAVPVSLLVAAVPVHYRISDLYSFLYNHSDSAKLLETICYRELTRYAASAKVEVDESSEMDESLLGAGRALAKQKLKENIQNSANDLGLGVEIVFVGLQGVHPPPQVAKDYQAVVSAIQEKQALILNAIAERNNTLSSVAGTAAEADKLYDLAARYHQAEEQNNEQLAQKLVKELDDAFGRAKGEIFDALRGARSYAFERATLAKATGERFASQLKAYRAAKEIYKHEQILRVLEEVTKDIRTYFVVAEENDNQIFIFDAKEKLTPSIYDIGGFEESSEK